MKKEDCEARTLTALGVGVGFGVLIGAALLASFYPMFQSEKWAAWLQAIGSIIAILVAIKVAARQSETSRQLQKEEFELLSQERRRARVDSLRAIEKSAVIGGRAARKTCHEILEMDINFLEDIRGVVSRKRPSLEVASEVLRKLPVQDFPGVLIGRYVLNIRVAFDRLLGLSNRLSSNTELDLEEVLSEIESIKNQLDRQLRRMDSFMDDYDGTLGMLRASDL